MVFLPGCSCSASILSVHQTIHGTNHLTEQLFFPLLPDRSLHRSLYPLPAGCYTRLLPQGQHRWMQSFLTVLPAVQSHSSTHPQLKTDLFRHHVIGIFKKLLYFTDCFANVFIRQRNGNLRILLLCISNSINTLDYSIRIVGLILQNRQAKKKRR